MIEHHCWRPTLYTEGIAGQRIAICGYSHYSDHRDHDELTSDIVGDVVSGAATYAFFTSIARAFGYDDKAAFYNRVLFFNFVPAIVGASEDKFAAASSAENERARARVRRILEENEPHKLFVFSEKAWAAFPKTDEEVGGLVAPDTEVRSGNYTTSRGHRVIAFGLRHPQGASAIELREAVVSGLGAHRP
jgi:hypothetical protein